MTRKRQKVHDGPFVPVPKIVLESKAWRAMSYGAQMYNIQMRRHLKNNLSNNGYVHLACRSGAKTMNASKNSILFWRDENEHYGFLRQTKPGFLGSDGRGIATRYRFTEYAYGNQPPTKDFLNWDGKPFTYIQHRHSRKAPHSKQNPVPKTGTPCPKNTYIRKNSGRLPYVPVTRTESNPKHVPKTRTDLDKP